MGSKNTIMAVELMSVWAWATPRPQPQTEAPDSASPGALQEGLCSHPGHASQARRHAGGKRLAHTPRPSRRSHQSHLPVLHHLPDLGVALPVDRKMEALTTPNHSVGSKLI